MAANTHMAVSLAMPSQEGVGAYPPTSIPLNCVSAGFQAVQHGQGMYRTERTPLGVRNF